MKRSISEMTHRELQLEQEKINHAIAKLENSHDEIDQAQLYAARAIWFALECRIQNAKPTPAPAPTPGVSNVISLAEFRAKREIVWL